MLTPVVRIALVTRVVCARLAATPLPAWGQADEPEVGFFDRSLAFFGGFGELFENGVLLQLLLDEAHEFEPIQLKQLDGLLQLRCHHQLLGQAQLLFQLDGHSLIPLGYPRALSALEA